MKLFELIEKLTEANGYNHYVSGYRDDYEVIFQSNCNLDDSELVFNDIIVLENKKQIVIELVCKD